MPSELEMQNYLKNHKKFRVNVGDKVVVFRTAHNEENGWNNSWPSGMDSSVGKTLKVEHDYGVSGFYMNDGYSYPYFVLKILR